MGRKKACFGREDYVCLTKDCPYMNECIQAVWEKKVSGLMRGSREKSKASSTKAASSKPASSKAASSKAASSKSGRERK